MAEGIMRAVMALPILLLAGMAEAGDYRLIEIDDTNVKWGEARLGGSAVISYAFVRERRKFPDARNCAAIKPLVLRSRGAEMARNRVETAFAEAAGEWAQVAGVEFVRAESEDVADLLIGAQVIPVGRAYANVTPAGTPAVESALQPETAKQPDLLPGKTADRSETPLRTLRQSLICLNADLPWKTGFDGDLETYDLRYTFLHEIGHVLGLDHVATSDAVMNFRYRENVATLQRGDIAGVTLLYGVNHSPQPAKAR
jgi:Matrixin